MKTHLKQARQKKKASWGCLAIVLVELLSATHSSYTLTSSYTFNNPTSLTIRTTPNPNFVSTNTRGYNGASLNNRFWVENRMNQIIVYK